MADTLPTSTTAATEILRAYLYQQYRDDDDLEGFVDAFNEIAQGYLDWFNDTPLPVYTSPAVSGQLLDWLAQGLYGIARPVIGVISTYSIGARNSFARNALPINGTQIFNSGTASAVTDDVYKRVLTWWLYRGDGKQMSIEWIKRRVSRFLYGANGGDIAYPVATPPSVSFGTSVITGARNSFPRGERPFNGSGTVTLSGFTITVPNTIIGQTFQALVQSGALTLPFQASFTVAL